MYIYIKHKGKSLKLKKNASPKKKNKKGSYLGKRTPGLEATVQGDFLYPQTCPLR